MYIGNLLFHWGQSQHNLYDSDIDDTEQDSDKCFCWQNREWLHHHYHGVSVPGGLGPSELMHKRHKKKHVFVHDYKSIKKAWQVILSMS